jgi:hypothetical protein
MFNLSAPLQTNLSAPLRRRSGGEPLNPGLPEHTPKKRRAKEAVLSTEGQQFDPNLGSRLEQAVDDRHRQIMSAQAPLKERIGDGSAKGATNDDSAKGATNVESAKGANINESNEGSDNKDNEHNAAPVTEKPIINEEVKASSQESSNVSIADKNAKAMSDLMWQEHPSSQAGFDLSSELLSKKGSTLTHCFGKNTIQSKHKRAPKPSSSKRTLKVHHQNGVIKMTKSFQLRGQGQGWGS